MKKYLCVIVIIMVLITFSSCTKPSPADTPLSTVTPAHIVATTPAYTWEFDPSSGPSAGSLVIIQPEDQVVAENDWSYFYAEHVDGSVGTWHIVSPDDRIDIHAEWIGSVMPPAVFVECDDNNGLTIHNTLARLDGWKVYCQFDDGTKTDYAYITIDKTQPRVGIEMPPM